MMEVIGEKGEESLGADGKIESLADYLSESIKFGRTRNLIETHQGSLYYFPEFGVDKTLMDTRQQIQAEALASYIRQRALAFNIVLIVSNAEIADFTSNITFQVED